MKATQRCSIPDISGSLEDVRAARRFVVEVTSLKADRMLLRQRFPDHRKFMPEAIAAELERWLAMDIKDKEFPPLRAIFQCMGRLESVTGLMSRDAAQLILERSKTLAMRTKSSFETAWREIVPLLKSQCMGPSFKRVVDVQRSLLGLPLRSTIALIVHVGELSGCLA